jgi:hypothetical protein
MRLHMSHAICVTRQIRTTAVAAATAVTTAAVAKRQLSRQELPCPACQPYRKHCSAYSALYRASGTAAVTAVTAAAAAGVLCCVGRHQRKPSCGFEEAQQKHHT